MRIRKLYECPECLGAGVLDDYAFSNHPTVCPSCDGSGQILAHPADAAGLFLMEPEVVQVSIKISATQVKKPAKPG